MPGFVDMSPISMMGTQRMNANEELLRRLLIDYGFLERPDGRYRLLPEPLPAHTGIAHDGRRIFPSKVRTAPPVEPAGDDEV